MRRIRGRDREEDEKGGIISTHVDEAFDLKNLKVAPLGEAAVEKRPAHFTVALRHVGPSGSHVPPVKPGTYGVFVSVGQRDGTPRIALPLPEPDALGRYKVGRITLR